MKRYTDHAANERTWLAWIRTAIAVVAFGFILERVELFSGPPGTTADNQLQDLKPLALLLVGAGTAVIVLATLRFWRHQRMIEENSEAPYRGGRTVAGLAALLVLVSLALAWAIL